MSPRYLSAILLATPLTFAFQVVEAQERRKPGGDQKCTTVESPGRMPRPPAPDSLSENSLSWKATTAQIRQLVEAAGIDQPGFIIFEIDPATKKRSIDFFDLAYPKALREEIMRRIAEHLNRWPEPYRILSMGPRYAPWDSTAQTFESCPPALRNREYITRSLKQTVAQYPGGRTRAPAAHKTVNVWLFTNLDGRVILSIIKDSSGDPYFDRAAKRIGREFEFHPALRDGFPIDVWVQIPITFAIRQ